MLHRDFGRVLLAFCFLLLSPPQILGVPPQDVEVRIPSGEIDLSGTLTVPDQTGPHPAVILVAGSGPQNRDAEALGFRPFKVMAEHFARFGIASLRYDKRGVSPSTGRFETSTMADFAEDVLTAFKFLRQHDDIDSTRIGLLGHSEGGIVAALAASRSSEVAFLVVMSSYGVDVETLSRLQTEAMGRASGDSEDQIQRSVEVVERIHKAARSGQFDEATEAELREQIRLRLEKLPEGQRPNLDQIVEAQIQQLLSPAFQYQLNLNPAEVFRRIRCATLILFGELDHAVPAEVNLRAIEGALQGGGNRQVAFKTIPNANHYYLKAQTGSIEEIAELKKEFVPGLLDLLTGWILTGHL
jgi:pimeloyl-ACP methyl ester carboxylesterase